MKFRNLLLVVMSVLLLSCDNDDYPYAEVPSVVLNEFWSQYPDAKDVEFHPAGEDHEVEFEIFEKDHSAVISASGKILKKKIESSWNDLPPAVQQTLQENYGQKKIEDPEQVNLGQDTLYQVEVNRFFRDDKIVLNKSGIIENGLDFWK